MKATEQRKKSFKELNETVQSLTKAIASGDYDSQLVNMTKAIEALQAAKAATLKLHGGISN